MGKYAKTPNPKADLKKFLKIEIFAINKKRKLTQPKKNMANESALASSRISIKDITTNTS